MRRNVDGNPQTIGVGRDSFLLLVSLVYLAAWSGMGAMFDSLAEMTFVSNAGTVSFCDGHASFNKLTPYLNIVERTRPEGGRRGKKRRLLRILPPDCRTNKTQATRRTLITSLTCAVAIALLRPE